MYTQKSMYTYKTPFCILYGTDITLAVTNLRYDVCYEFMSRWLTQDEKNRHQQLDVNLPPSGKKRKSALFNAPLQVARCNMLSISHEPKQPNTTVKRVSSPPSVCDTLPSKTSQLHNHW